MGKSKTQQPGRDVALMMRLSDREREMFTREAGREPLSTWARRILVEYCERRQKKGVKA